MNNKTKNYYAPIQTFLVLLFYIILGEIIFYVAIYSKQSFETFFIYFLMLILIIERVIRFSYHLKIYDGKIYESGLFTRKRIITINLITRIRWKKENFWYGGFWLPGMGDSNWQRQYYIESPEHILPMYAITPTLINDLVKIRPDLIIEKGGVKFK